HPPTTPATTSLLSFLPVSPHPPRSPLFPSTTLSRSRALDTKELLAGQGRARAQLAQTIEPHGGKPRRLDRRHVRARAFDAQHRDLLAEEVRHRGLHRGIAAAMQHELGIAADEARGVDAQREIAADAVTGIAVDRRLRLAVDPAAFHRRAPSRARKTPRARGADGATAN